MIGHLKILNLKCVSCGSNLEVTESMDRFCCGYCGSEQYVERQGGTVSLKPVIDAISRVQTGTDKTAAELALQRLRQELTSMEIQGAEHIAKRQAQLEAARTTLTTIIGAGVIVTLIFPLPFIISLLLGEPSASLAGIVVFAAIPIWTFRYFAKRYERNTVMPIVNLVTSVTETHQSKIKDLKKRIAKNRAIADS